MANKSRVLLIQKYLYDNTDYEHAVNTREIKDMLAENGIRADTRTIDTAIDQLIDAGHDISVDASHGKATCYKVDSRTFETV